MHAPHKPSFSSTPSRLAKTTILIATLLPRTYAANQWLYPDVHSIPTYNFLDTVNASWTSNFVAPYLLLLCHPPDDTAHPAYPYNQSIPATGSSLVALDDGYAWTCHFQVSDLHDSSANPPTFISNDFNIILNYGLKPFVWSDTNSNGGGSAASGAIANPTTGSPTSSIRSSEPTLSPTTTNPTSLASTSTSSPPPPAPPIPSSPSASTPSRAPTPSPGLSKSQKVAIIVGTVMGALFLLILASAILFVRGLRRIERNTGVVYRRSGASRSGDGYGAGKEEEVPGLEAPRERWKGVELHHDHQMQGFF